MSTENNENMDDLDLDLDLDDLADELNAELDIPEDEGKKIRIPKERFDEAVGKERERAERAEQRLQELEESVRQSRAQSSVQQAPSMAQVRQAISELEEKYEELLIDGERAEAKVVRGQLNELRDYQRAEENRRYAAEAQSNAVQSSRYERALIEVEDRYPELNPDSDSFDSEATTEVAQLTQAFLAQGVSQGQALHRAARYVLGAPTGGRQSARDALRQPPSAVGAGRSSSSAPTRVASLSQAQFEKLDERALARLRGDEL